MILQKLCHYFNRLYYSSFVRNRTADHQEQQACKANTDNRQAIPSGSVGQTHSERPYRRHSKTN